MRYVSLFLALLLLSEVLIIEPTVASLMMLYLPLKGAIMAYKTYKFTMKMSVLADRMMLMSRMFRLVMNRQENRMKGLFWLSRDSCLRRMLCELKRGRPQPPWTTLLSKFGSIGMTPEGRLAITINLTKVSKESCARKFKSCPYSSMDMFQAAKKFGSVWQDLNMPRTVNNRMRSSQDKVT